MACKILFSLLAVVLCANAVFGVNIISKKQWGGRSPKSRSNLASDLSYAIIHHTAGAYCSTQAVCSQQLRNIQNYHMDSLDWSDIGYNFLIGGDGQVYEGRGWSTMGAHATSWNSKSIGISFIGNYNIYKPTAAQIVAAKALLADAVSRGQIKSNQVKKLNELLDYKKSLTFYISNLKAYKTRNNIKSA